MKTPTSSAHPLATLAAAAAAGAAAMYLLDPQRGVRRAKRLRDKTVHAAHVAADFAGTAKRDAANRLDGLAASARIAVRDTPPDDRVLEERVRAELGRLVSHPGAVEVQANDGVVVLSGDVLADEHDELVSQVAKVRGVVAVEDAMREHDDPSGVPALQGQPRPRKRRSELAQENWSPAIRVLTGAIGAAVAYRGSRQRGIAGALMSASGLLLLSRALTNEEVDRMLGIGGGRNAHHVHKAINVVAEPDEVFTYLTSWERWPEWMSHVRSVTVSGPPGVGQRSHWVVDGPGGVPVSWDAEITDFEPSRLVAWRTVNGQAIRHAERLRFEPNDDGSVRVSVQMTYNPPAGMAGHAIAKLFGRDPRSQMDADLARLKTAIEVGQPPHDAAAASG